MADRKSETTERLDTLIELLHQQNVSLRRINETLNYILEGGATVLATVFGWAVFNFAVLIVRAVSTALN